MARILSWIIGIGGLLTALWLANKPYSNTPIPNNKQEKLESYSEDVDDSRKNSHLEQMVDSLNSKVKEGKLKQFIVVDKSEYKLAHHSKGKKKIYEIALGINPEDDKKILGDHCTLEGWYYICAKNPHSLYYKALVFNYPNPKDAKDGLKRGIISKQEYNKIIKTFKQKRTPPLDTKLGPGMPLEVHGCPEPYRLDYNWTWGCVAVSNSAIDELYEKVKVGTPIIIKP